MARADAAPRTGALARGAITGLAATRIGMAHLGHRLGSGGAPDAERQAQHETELGRILFQTLGQLRGTALKVSQLLSMDTTLLPEGVRRELARACHQALPLNRALVGRVFRQSFGQEPEALFAQFEPQAFAAASLGQVHRARLDGHGTVAVKVQYPGIAATIGSDMRLLRAALKALGQGALALPEPPVVERVLQELEATLHREVDYLHEARQLAWFADHATLPGVAIPRPVASHTRAQVLTLEHMEGQHLDDWLRAEPPQAWRDAAGQHLFDWFLYCAFGLGQLHADLHPGNVLFQSEGRIALLDFGCTRALSAGFRAGLAHTWSTVLRPDGPARNQDLLAAYRALGLAAPSLDLRTFTHDLLPALAPLLDWQVQPLRAPCFDFAHKTPQQHPAPAQQRLLARHLAGIPPEMPAFERAWMGLMHLLTRLGARVDTANRWIAPPATQSDTLLSPAPTCA